MWNPAGAWLQPENLRPRPGAQALAGWAVASAARPPRCRLGLCGAERRLGLGRGQGRKPTARLSAQGGCGRGGDSGDGRLRGREFRPVLVSDNALKAGAHWRSALAL